MRPAFLFHTAVLLWLLLVLQSAAQTAIAPTPVTTESLSQQYTLAMQSKDWAGAVTAAQKLSDLSATAEHLRMLGNAQLYSGASDAALATYGHALSAASQEKPADGQPDAAWKETIAKIYIGRGNALLKLRRTPDALADYRQAASLAPDPSQVDWNICAVLYNTGDTANGLAACRTASTVEPARADTWFVLASLLFAESSKTDPQGKFIIPDECRQALNKYLELAPNGPHAGDVKAMLDMASPAH